MRIIQQSMRLTAKLTGFQDPEEPFYILELIDQACTTALNIDPKLLDDWTEQAFRSWMHDSSLHPAQIRLLVEILDKKAEMAARAEEAFQEQAFLQKTIITLEYLNDVEQTFSLERQARIHRLKERLNNDLPNHKED